MELLKEYLISNFLFVQLVPALFGVFSLRKLKTPIYKFFVWLLVYVFANEIVAQWYGTNIHIGFNQIFFNSYNIINFLFLFLLFYHFAQLKVFKGFIIFIVLTYILTVIVELNVYQVNYHETAQKLPFLVGGFGILFCVLFYFYQNLLSEKVFNFEKDLMFWISSAYFIYYLAYVPFKLKQNYFAHIDAYGYLFKILIIATFVKSIILIVGFIWSKERQKS